MTLTTRLLITAGACILGACATHEPGWTGSDATPFGQAEAACGGMPSDARDAAARAAFEACMREQGWTRQL
jgi:hypothetical protein